MRRLVDILLHRSRWLLECTRTRGRFAHKNGHSSPASTHCLWGAIRQKSRPPELDQAEMKAPMLRSHGAPIAGPDSRRGRHLAAAMTNAPSPLFAVYSPGVTLPDARWGHFFERKGEQPHNGWLVA